jgi:hypothetical protein
MIWEYAAPPPLPFGMKPLGMSERFESNLTT